MPPRKKAPAAKGELPSIAQALRARALRILQRYQMKEAAAIAQKRQAEADQAVVIGYLDRLNKAHTVLSTPHVPTRTYAKAIATLQEMQMKLAELAP